MSHTTLLDFEFTYGSKIPRVPIRFFNSEGSIQNLNYEKFDSESTHIFIPKAKAEELKLNIGQNVNGFTSTKKTKVQEAIVNFRLGNKGQFVDYFNIPIGVTDGSKPQILIGIEPIWEDYIVTINAYTKKIIMKPRVL